MRIKNKLFSIKKTFFQSKKTFSNQTKTFPLSHKKRREHGRKDGRKEGRQGGRKEGRKEGRREERGRKEGGKEGEEREEGRKEGRKEKGRKKGRKEGKKEGRKAARKGRKGRKATTTTTTTTTSTATITITATTTTTTTTRKEKRKEGKKEGRMAGGAQVITWPALQMWMPLAPARRCALSCVRQGTVVSTSNRPGTYTAALTAGEPGAKCIAVDAAGTNGQSELLNWATLLALVLYVAIGLLVACIFIAAPNALALLDGDMHSDVRLAATGTGHRRAPIFRLRRPLLQCLLLFRRRQLPRDRDSQLRLWEFRCKRAVWQMLLRVLLLCWMFRPV